MDDGKVHIFKANGPSFTSTKIIYTSIYFADKTLYSVILCGMIEFILLLILGNLQSFMNLYTTGKKRMHLEDNPLLFVYNISPFTILVMIHVYRQNVYNFWNEYKQSHHYYKHSDNELFSCAISD